MGGSSARLLFRQHSTRPKNVEYLYGASVVIPAMEFGVRKIKTLLVKEDQRFGGMKIRGNGEAILSSKILPKISSADMGQDSRALLDYAVALANQREIPVKEVPVSHLDRLAGNRPHQGLVLATLAPKVTHLHALGNCDLDANDVDFEKNVYEVDAGGDGILRLKTREDRKYPFWIALDQIVDPQNLGAILRSAYYFGVDGVVVTERDSAPFSPISSKASAGAMEAMPLYSTVNLGKLLQESAINGWQILGTNTNAKKSDLIPLCHFKQRCDMEVSNDLDDLKTHTPLLRLDSAPTILVLGNEGHGMRTLVSKHCHHHLIITQDQFSPNFKKSRIDSLNVSVAAGILLHELLLSV
ncbi:hypothetical protein BATDEDRAFT_85791 [Batrachochytrium dendrobatidis JAM81]|uniref:rRNA methyltransferase 1, mitochondrial n=1 Tax=Batrachochytrium dendrobatidis (strain JAM81 / FGSC 10211) TaxID=684364 RepID=F4NUA4_BATDJ|nr:uncharacterized protein BATDEDRAFT_85791 [Batrachochytrium dendrobatidis JAM81]EGF83170.1 hypothetical protein BATDEDRAFT_85791 [Batrachochytrium dendrobatidis JAM81]|eukprot:XP_006676003.1 hypothetical protein BATDEDRAFT_85791 [Batrachochytrium dendrobatidis JAM81]